MNKEIFKEKGTRSMTDKELLFKSEISYSHAHTDLEGFVCPKCGWCVPKSSISTVLTQDGAKQ